MEFWFFLFVLLLTLALMFWMIFYIISFDDLDHDRCNPIDLCDQLNKYVIPEFVIHAALTTIFLLTRHWWLVVVNLPLDGCHAKLYVDGKHMHDCSVVYRDSRRFRKVAYVKVGFYAVSALFYAYRLVFASVTFLIPIMSNLLIA